MHSRTVAGRKRKLDDKSGVVPAVPVGGRFRARDVYDLVRNQGVRDAVEVQALACKQDVDGDARLAEFCTAMGEERLNELIQNALAVVQAPRTLTLKQSARVDLMRQAAIELPCSCNGVWIPAAIRALWNNHEDVGSFCRDVWRALEFGAIRGANVAIIGEPGCGKSMLFEPFDGIFAVMGKPQNNSSFALAGVLDAQVLLWQDWKQNDGTVLFEDVLSLLVGERMDIRVPNKKNVSFRNTSPLFYTSNTPLSVVRPDLQQTTRLNAAMAERFCTRTWHNPLPPAQRIANLPRCSRCCANFFVTYR